MEMTSTESVKDTKTPLALFAMSFRSYSIGLGIIMAALPFAISAAKLLPMYEGHRNILTLFTSLLSLLGVAFLFCIRRKIGAAVFPSGGRRLDLSDEKLKKRAIFGWVVPGSLIGLCIMAMLSYHFSLSYSLEHAAINFARTADNESLDKVLAMADPEANNSIDKREVSVIAYLFGEKEDASAEVRARAWDEYDSDDKFIRRAQSLQFGSQDALDTLKKSTPSTEIPLHWLIEISYIAMFCSAAMALVYCALIEHIQNTMSLNDETLMKHGYVRAPTHLFCAETVEDLSDDPVGVHFVIQYDRGTNPPTLVSGPKGPFCSVHGNNLAYMGTSERVGYHIWSCQRVQSDGKTTLTVDLHPVVLAFDRITIAKEAKKATEAELVSLQKSNNSLQQGRRPSRPDDVVSSDSTELPDHTESS